MKIIFATGNRNKLKEASQILGSSFELITPADIGITEDIPETSDTIKGNAIQKAEYLFSKTGNPCFADDTGLEVDALNGAPGVYSARYAGEGKKSSDNMHKLLTELHGTTERTAQFRTTIALILKNGELHTFDGIIKGSITTAEKGTGGFGYDPIFMPDGYDKTFAELSDEEKNKISHRGLAMKKLQEFLSRGDF